MSEAKKTEKLVKFRAFKDDGRYKDDIFVRVKGKTYQIKRGVDVMIPQHVYNVLVNNQAQSQAAYRLMDERASEFEAETNKLSK